MDPAERSTGTRDEQYNLVSVLYHALQGAETIEAYVLDAEAAGDDRLAGFFREAQATYRQLAEQAKGRLGVLEVPSEPEIVPDAPPEGGISPGAMAGGIPPPEPVDAEPGGVAPPLDAGTPVGGAPDVPREGRVPPEGRMPPGGEVPPDATLEDVPPREAGVPPDAALGDVPLREADERLEPEVRAEQVDVPTEGIPPTTDVPRTPPDAALPPEGDVVEPGGAPPGGVPHRGTTPEAPPRDVPPAGVSEDVEGDLTPGRPPDAPPPGGGAGEPGLAAPEQRATTQPQEEEEKGLIEKAKDKLTEAKDRLAGEPEDRPHNRR